MKPKILSKIYFPGLISLVFLPLMCIGYFMYHNQLSRWAVMDVPWADESELNKPIWGRDAKPFNIYRYRKYLKILIGSETTNEEIIDTIQKEVKKLVALKDTVNGYRVMFKPNATYGSLVTALDVAFQIEGNSAWIMLYKGEIFIGAHGPNNVPTNNWVCSFQQFNRIAPPKPSFYDILIETVSSWPSDTVRLLPQLANLWPSLIPFSLMIFFAIKNKRKLSAT